MSIPKFSNLKSALCRVSSRYIMYVFVETCSISHWVMTHSPQGNFNYIGSIFPFVCLHVLKKRAPCLASGLLHSLP